MKKLFAAGFVCLSLACSPAPKPQPDAGVNPWRLVQEDLPGTLLSAWESPDGVLYAVGGNASSALVLRHDSGGWWVMDSGTTKTLWWVHGYAANDVYAVGAAGVVTHFDGTRWTVLREGGDFTLFGAWGARPDELVAVGGVVTASAPRPAMVMKSAGWNEVSTSTLPPDRALFKVWGTSASDLFVVGERGLAARGVPGAFTLQPVPTTQRLTTVHGAGSQVYAVGGLQTPVLARFDGASWNELVAPGNPQLLNGVAVNADGEVVVVGLDGYLAEGKADTFRETLPLTRRGLHGVATTRTGFVAVGGELLGSFGQGVLLARGELASGALKTWLVRGIAFDAGVDAGVDAGTDAGIDAGEEDAGPPQPPDGGWYGPGASCDQNAQGCEPGLSCWFVFGPYTNFCAATCADSSQCGAYGVGACCTLPGPQVSTPVCLPFDAGRCDAG